LQAESVRSAHAEGWTVSVSGLVVSEFLSLDGVMEEPRWTFEYHDKHPWTEDQMKFKNGELFGSDSLLLGRVTHQGFAAACPSMQNDPEGYGKRMNSLPKYVVSRTLDRVDWNNSGLIQGDVAAEVSKLKQQPGQDISVFGSSLVQSLMQLGLVDELRLMVYPVVLGSGKRLFSSALQTTLKPVEARAFGSGVVLLRYQADK
jgi:dihydrofolate reductase